MPICFRVKPTQPAAAIAVSRDGETSLVATLATSVAASVSTSCYVAPMSSKLMCRHRLKHFHRLHVPPANMKQMINDPTSLLSASILHASLYTAATCESDTML